MTFLVSLTLTLPHFLFFFFNDPAPTEIYTLSLHDALPIWRLARPSAIKSPKTGGVPRESREISTCPRLARNARSEEHTSELQSRQYLVCRLLLEKKKKKKQRQSHSSQNTRRTSKQLRANHT